MAGDIIDIVVDVCRCVVWRFSRVSQIQMVQKLWNAIRLGWNRQHTCWKVYVNEALLEHFVVHSYSRHFSAVAKNTNFRSFYLLTSSLHRCRVLYSTQSSMYSLVVVLKNEEARLMKSHVSASFFYN